MKEVRQPLNVYVCAVCHLPLGREGRISRKVRFGKQTWYVCHHCLDTYGQDIFKIIVNVNIQKGSDVKE